MDFSPTTGVSQCSQIAARGYRLRQRSELHVGSHVVVDTPTADAVGICRSQAGSRKPLAYASGWDGLCVMFLERLDQEWIPLAVRSLT